MSEQGRRWTEVALVLGLAVLSGCGPTREERTLRRMIDLRRVGYAMELHAAWFGDYPPRALLDEEGRPLLSWRVMLLPYLDEEPLYDQFHLNEPWDSEHNIKLLKHMPEVYRLPGLEDDVKTSLMVFDGEGTPFGGEKGPVPQDLKDGPEHTIMFVEAGPDKAVPWTKPDDLPFRPDDPVAALGNIPDDGFYAVLFDLDEQILQVKRDIDVETMRRLIQHQDNLPVDLGKEGLVRLYP